MSCRSVVLLLLLGGPATFTAAGGESPVGARERVFALKDVSALTLLEKVPELAGGQQAVCTQQPDPNVRGYPGLRSDRPVYASAQFSSLYEERNPALLYHFVADESGGPGTGYDRLYADLNGNGDLRDDVPVAPRKDAPPELLLRYTSIEKEVFFENIGIPLPFGSEGLRPLEVVPRLLLLKSGGAMLSFVPTRARRGRIEVGGRGYDVFLGQIHPVCGWFDHPQTVLRLVPRGVPATKAVPAAASLLMTMPRLEGTYYRFAATPAGEKLTVRPYDGPMGALEIGGGPKFQTADITATGWLRSRDAVVSLAGAECRLPAGDYVLDSVTVTHKELSFAIQPNYHSDGGFRSRLYHAPTYPVPIRAGERFILDFSRQPRIIFADPPKDSRVKVGQRMFVEAVLADPVLDFVVSNLNYTPPPQDAPAKLPAGTRAAPRSVTLNPHVKISHPNGEVVDEGTMHYG
jgi:hypothetical protein